MESLLLERSPAREFLFHFLSLYRLICRDSSFWLNFINIAGPTCQRRFVDEFDVFVRAVVEQAQDRDHLVFRGYFSVSPVLHI